MKFFSYVVIKMNEYFKTNKYDKNFISENMMGPNSLKILEELTNDIPLKRDMIKADSVRYMNIISITGNLKQN